MPIGFPNGDQYEDEVMLQADPRWQAPIINPDEFVQNRTGVEVGSEWDYMESSPVPQERESVNQEPKLQDINYQVSRENGVTRIRPNNVEDRRGEDRLNVPFSESMSEIGTSIKNYVMGTPVDAAELTEIGKQLGYQDIDKKSGIRDLGSTSPLDSLISGTVDAINLGGHVIHAIQDYRSGENNPRRFIINPEASSKAEFSKGTLAGNRLFGTGGEERYKTWPERAVTSGIEAIQRLMSGDREYLSTTAGAGDALEIAGALVFGPAPIARKAVDGTLGSFAGVKANLPAEKLFKAQEIIQSKGFDPERDAEKLWRETGFFKGADGKLRYEIDDSNARLGFVSEKFIRGEEEMSLGSLLNHPELYKAYPDAKDIKVQYDPKLPDDNASFYPDRNTMVLGPGTLDNITVVMHELQHWIQKKEGFAKGGSPAKDFRLRFERQINALDKEAETIINKYNGDLEKASVKDMDRLEFIVRVLDKDMRRNEIASDVAFDNYTKLAGEVESVNVEDRILSAAARRKPPWQTERAPRSEQYVNTESFQWATPYGYGDPMYPPPYASSTPKPANDITSSGNRPFKNYEGSLDDQAIKKLMTKDTKVGDFNYWQRIAEQEGHNLYKSPNAYAAVRAHSKDGKTAMIIEDDGRRIFYKDGEKVVREKRKNLSPTDK